MTDRPLRDGGPPEGAPASITAVLFDLDGVLTDTTRLHVAAWTETLDGLLEDQGRAPDFDPGVDYREHVDGKPRLDGVRDFAAERRLELPEGTREDEPGFATVHAVGRLKNDRYLALLADQGADLLDGAIGLVSALRRRGLGVAVVSSSRNARRVLGLAGLDEAVDVVVDGVDLARLGLPGKPDPALYLRAAGLLGVAPDHCAVVEDARAGIEAARGGGFALAVGVAADPDAADALRRSGADVVVTGVDALAPDPARWWVTTRPVDELPSALADFDTLVARLDPERTLVCCDYDGTLSPIVEDPRAAVLSDEARSVLARLARACPVAVVSGRDLGDVRERVDLDQLVYAGSHGFEIVGPGGLAHEHEPAVEVLPDLDEIEQRLGVELSDLEGVMVERKRYAVAVHTRRAADESGRSTAQERTHAAAAGSTRLRAQDGKEIVEIRPDLPWDKGAAVEHLASVIRSSASETEPLRILYLGDDTTDEDAFVRLERSGSGEGIHVGTGGRTAARHRLTDVGQVTEFLDRLADRFGADGQTG